MVRFLTIFLSRQELFGCSAMGQPRVTNFQKLLNKLLIQHPVSKTRVGYRLSRK
jgi:hypothetical protein